MFLISKNFHLVSYQICIMGACTIHLVNNQIFHWASTLPSEPYKFSMGLHFLLVSHLILLMRQQFCLLSNQIFPNGLAFHYWIIHQIVPMSWHFHLVSHLTFLMSQHFYLVSHQLFPMGQPIHLVSYQIFQKASTSPVEP
jgi:hypothetical protein